MIEGQPGAEMKVMPEAGSMRALLPLSIGLLLALASSALAQDLSAPVTVEGCVPCHGVDGIGRDVEIPNLAGQHEVYLYRQLVAFRSGKRRHPEMRFMARTLGDEEMKALAAYFASLPRQ
jgi:cytochrome c553